MSLALGPLPQTPPAGSPLTGSPLADSARPGFGAVGAGLRWGLLAPWASLAGLMGPAPALAEPPASQPVLRIGAIPDQKPEKLNRL